MRFRLLHRLEKTRPLTQQGTVMGQNSIPTCSGHWKPESGVQGGDTHEDALRSVAPAAGRWLVLCEDDRTWRMFTVTRRTEIDLAPVDEASDLATALVALR